MEKIRIALQLFPILLEISYKCFPAQHIASVGVKIHDPTNGHRTHVTISSFIHGINMTMRKSRNKGTRVSMKESTDAALYLPQTIRAALRAGDKILDIYRSNFAVEFKRDHSPLTLADTESHNIITGELKKHESPVLSEEGRSVPYRKRKTWKTLWIVDPLDGTKEFVRRNGEFTVNIAYVVNGRPFMGVIVIPVRNLVYFASRGIGAYKADAGRLVDVLGRLKEGTDASEAVSQLRECALPLPAVSTAHRPFTIVGSRSHVTPELSRFVDEKRRLLGHVVFRAAGSSLKFCLVAEGVAHAYPRFGPTMEWDTAAGQAIAEAAGAHVLDMTTGTPLRYNKEDLANPSFIVVGPGVDVPMFPPAV